MNNEITWAEKELSWLSFNARVLQEAMDKTVPLIERVRFLGIFSNNQDEFFKVRVADVKRRVMIHKEHGGDEQAEDLLHKIQDRVMELGIIFDNTYHEVMMALARHNIFLINENQTNDTQQLWLREFFKEKVLRHISPILLTNDIDPVNFLKDQYTYLAIKMKKEGKPSQYALIEVPTDHVPRFVPVPNPENKNKKVLIILDNVIRLCLDDIFRGFFDYDNIAAYSVKMTRDAEFDLSSQMDLTLLEKTSEGLKQRLKAMPVRFSYDREMPQIMVDFLTSKLEMSHYDSIMPGGRYHNFKDFMNFPNVGRPYLENHKLPAFDSHDFEQYQTVFQAISAKDILLHYPYHKFKYLTEMLRQASFDPAVVSIKINIYRVASQSRVVESLIDAANNGKRVTVVVELQARFDEAANIKWANRLKDAGVKVLFGLDSLKIHSKLCVIVRKEQEQLVSYSHIGTGNFNEKTAKIYTDFAYFTKNQELGNEVNNVFEFIEHPYLRIKFNHLIVSPINSRRTLYRLIDTEINNAKAGLPAKMTIKLNNLVDLGIIQRLYAASQAGVVIRMIIRGMCSLIPAIPGLSENISIISIVDRFLEHPRVMIFHNNGNEKIFISSADWMTRNIDHRVEVGTPIYDDVLKKRIVDLMELQFNDTTKARVIDPEQLNHYVLRGNRRKIRSQIAIYDYLQRLELQEDAK